MLTTIDKEVLKSVEKLLEQMKTMVEWLKEVDDRLTYVEYKTGIKGEE